jgi:hypothetical protein
MLFSRSIDHAAPAAGERIICPLNGAAQFVTKVLRPAAYFGKNISRKRNNLPAKVP